MLSMKIPAEIQEYKSKLIFGLSARQFFSIAGAVLVGVPIGVIGHGRISADILPWFVIIAQGNIFNAGGVVGSAAGTRAYDAKGRELPNCYGGSIQGCLARNIILKTETAAGGIAAEGTTDAEGALISNCYCNELDFSCGEFKDAERVECIKAGTVGGIIAEDGSGHNGHTLMNCVSHADFKVIGLKTKSAFDDTVRLAPAYAYYQENILTVLNKNTVSPVNPKEIYTGSFMFGESGVFGDDQGSLAYPEKISDLLAKTIVEDTKV